MFHRAPVDELEQTQHFVIGDCEQRAKWCFNPLGKQTAVCFGRRWRFTENTGEGVTKTALRFKAAAVPRLVDASAAPHCAQCESHSPRAMVRLEGHSVMALELPPRRGRIDRHGRELLVSQSPAWRAFHFRTQALNQFRRAFAR